LRGCRVHAEARIGPHKDILREQLVDQSAPGLGFGCGAAGVIPDLVQPILMALECCCDRLLEFVLVEVVCITLEVWVEECKRRGNLGSVLT
jgi:hypothetical protein